VRKIYRRSLTIRTLLVGAVLAALLSGAFAVLVVAVREQQAAGRLALRSQQAIGAGSGTVSEATSRAAVSACSSRSAPPAGHTRGRPRG
jgi:hypothetical protein